MDITQQPSQPGARRSWLAGAWRAAQRYRSGKTTTGLAILVAFLLVGVIGPHLLSSNPTQPTGASLLGPSAGHWLGTTLQDQDVFTQLVDGTGSSLEVGFVAGAIATAVAVVIGLLAGYARGLGGELFSGLSNIFLVIPSLPLVIVLAGYLPKAGFLSITLVIAVTSWAGGARVIRAQSLAMVHRDYVQSAKAIGEPVRRILFAEIFPNLLTIVMSTFLFAVIGAIAAEAGLAFLGLGDVNQVSWGYMINLAEANDALFSGAWWWWLPPGLCYALVGAALGLINFGIDEIGNPRLRMVRLAARTARLQERQAARRPAQAAVMGASGGTR
jgi:ABC-type dipeptide/oligopeptide/nickel transport system permease subunit